MPQPPTCPTCKTLLKKDRIRCHICGQFCVSQERPRFSNGEDGTILLSDVIAGLIPRLRTGPWDRNFGYCGNDEPTHECYKCGMAVNSVTLLAGGPGVGKSTIGLQIGNSMAKATGREFLYVGAEEDADQVKDRATRLALPYLHLIRIIPLENMDRVSLEHILEKRHANMCGVVVDSTQAFTNDPEQAVEILQGFKLYSSKYRFPFIAINQVTKSEDMAGLMKLQHATDTNIMASKGGDEEIFDVLGENDTILEIPGKSIRMFDTEKNRFGPADEKVRTHFLMTEKGLQYVELADEEEVDDE